MKSLAPRIRKLSDVLLATLSLACGESNSERIDREAHGSAECSIPPADGIILISIDTLRADRLHAYGYEPETSPSLDRMAREGARFANVVAPSSWTLPSHATMLTGLDPTHHRVVGFGSGARMPEGLITVAERFLAAGFRTAAFVGGGFVSREQGFDRGFEKFSSSGLKYVFPGRLVAGVEALK